MESAESEIWMVYQYVAYNENGEIVNGRLTATSEEVATNLLDYVGYQVISLKPRAQFLNLDRMSASLSRIKPAELILFNRQLAVLLESGINIITSLELLQSQASNRTLKKVMGDVISDLRGGEQLSAALDKHPSIFPPIYCRLLEVGEQTGGIDAILLQIADYMEKEAAVAKSIKGALVYPITASLVTIGVIAVLVTFVIPAFGGLYDSLGADLPAMTRILLSISDKAQNYGAYLMLAVLAVAGMAFVYTKTPGGRYQRDKLLLKLPLLGRITHLKELTRCCRNLSLLYSAGLPLTEIMPLVIQGSGNSVVSRALADVQQEMIEGEGLSQPMAKNQLFLPMMVQMVKVGEESGKLDSTLNAVARSYETEAEDKTRSLIGLIQPVMTLILAVVIGFIALSLVSAMYSIYGQMG